MKQLTIMSGKLGRCENNGG